MVTRRQMLQGGAAASLLWMPAIFAPSIARAAKSSGPLGGKILPTPDFATLRKDPQFLAGVRPHRT